MSYVPPISVFNTCDCDTPKSIAQQVNLAQSNSGTIDLSQLWNQSQIKGIQSIYIDNSNNSEPFSVNITATQQTITCPARTQGYFPILVSIALYFNYSSTGNSGIVNLNFLDFLVAAQLWSVAQ